MENFIPIIFLLSCILALLVYLLLLVRKSILFNTGQDAGTKNKGQSLHESESAGSFLEQEVEYLALIDKAVEEKKVYLAKHCFNRLPGSYQLLAKLWSLLNEEITDHNKPAITRRELIGDMYNAINLYRINCPVTDLEKAVTIDEELKLLSGQVLEQLRKDEEGVLTQLIGSLEESIMKLSKDVTNAELLEETERIDRRISKERLDLYPGLKARYKDCSSELMRLFKSTSGGSPDAAKIQQYNREAIRSHKIALEKFQDKKGFKDVIKDKIKNRDFKFNNDKFLVEGIVKELGGWEHEYLYPSTLAYTNSVYMKIFTGFNSDEQLRLTELMVKEKKKLLQGNSYAKY